MQNELIEKLKELCNMDFSKDIDLGTEWIDIIPIDRTKINNWHQNIISILNEINPKYSKQFTEVQQEVSKHWEYSDLHLDEYLKKSCKYLKEIIKDIEQIYVDAKK